MDASFEPGRKTGHPFHSVLIANRGEIAVRIERACKELGLRAIRVASEADRAGAAAPGEGGPLSIGPSTPTRSYLNQAAILLAARVTGAEAIHPGYGFLSENAEFAEAVERAGLVFVGPPASAIRIMGDKIAAKRAMMAAGVPCVPGPGEPLPDNIDAVRATAEAIGYPVIVKAAGGGGGRGMRVVRDGADIADAVVITREEARRAFGKPRSSTWKSFWSTPAMSNSRCSATITAMQSGLVIAIAPFSDGTRRSSRRRRHPVSHRNSQRGSARAAQRPAGRSAIVGLGPSSSFTSTASSTSSK